MPDYIGADARRIERTLSIEIEHNEELRAEIERLRAAFDEQNFGRLAVIEECARVIERWEHADEPLSYLDLIRRIRALKDKP